MRQYYKTLIGIMACMIATVAHGEGFSSGTGFFVTDTGIIATNAHVIKGCQSIAVKSRDLGIYSATVVTADARNDIAVLKLEKFDKKSPAPALNYRARLGESSYVFGFPLTGVLSDTGNFTTGTVSSLQGIGNDSSKIQISTPVQPGNSGGPVLDDKGNLIAVVVGKLDALKNIAETKDIAQNVNFAIKSQILDGVLQAVNISMSSQSSTQVKQSVDIAEFAQSISVHILCKTGELAKQPSSQNSEQAKPSYPQQNNQSKKLGPVLLGSFGEWGAYATDVSAKGRVCYVLNRPKQRLPYEMKRDDGYIFISARPAENVYNEVSFVIGFPTTDGSSGTLTINNNTFTLVTRGTSAWLKNASEDRYVVELMKKNYTMQTTISSARGNVSIDTYKLSGLEQAIYRIRKECP